MIMLVLVVGSCKKSLDKYPIDVRMTDASATYDAVNIDLQGVEITGSNGTAVLMDVNAGIYNLLNFSNGVDTLLATGGLEVSEISQIRLILGPNSTIVVDGTSYPLSTPSADQSGLKLQVHQALEAGVLYTVLLDFDANKSVVVTGNNTYKLKPVIRTIETAIHRRRRAASYYLPPARPGPRQQHIRRRRTGVGTHPGLGRARHPGRCRPERAGLRQ